MMLLWEEVNLWAVLVSAVVSMGVGFLWYSPLVFGKRKKSPALVFPLMFVGLLFTAFVLAQIVQYVGALTWLEGLEVGFWLWLGFVAPVMLSNALFQDKPIGLYLIDCGYHLASLLAMSVILTIWV